MNATNNKVLMTLKESKKKSISQIAAIGRKYKLLKYPILLFLVLFIFIYNFAYYFCLYLKMKERAAKAIAMAMCVILCVTSIDITAFALTDAADSDKNIVGFSSLSEKIANQKVNPDATLEDIKFPESLDVHVTYQIEKEIEVEVEEEKATPTPTPTPSAEITPTSGSTPSAEPTPTAESTPGAESTPSTEPTPSAEVAPTEIPASDEDNTPEAVSEDNQNSDVPEQDASANEPPAEEIQSDDTQNNNTQGEDAESQPDGEQIAKITNCGYDIESVYIPMEYCAAEPSKEEGVVETLEKDETPEKTVETNGDNVGKEDTDEETSNGDNSENNTETKKEIVIEEVEEDVTVSATWSIDEERSSKTEFKDLEVGDKYIFVPTITEERYKLAEYVELPVITVTVDENQATFEKSVTVEGVVITVTADEGVFPEDATIEARKVTTNEEKEVEEAIDEVRDEEKNVAVSYTFDITIYDKDGNEIEPDTSKGSVKVTFKMAEIANENLETDVYHVEETDDGLNAEGLAVTNKGANTDDANIDGTNTDGGDASGSANDEITVETTGFSFYTVEFTYGELQYVLEGDERVELTTILDAVGIKENGEITAVEGSNDELFKPVFEDDVWYIEALKAFNSEEWLKVTIDGIEYEIVVTDDQTVSTWSDLQTALSGTSNDTVKLGSNITAGSGDTTLSVSGTKTLDLNGYVINADGRFRVINVNSSATLTIKDSDSDKMHYFTVQDNLWKWNDSNTTGAKSIDSLTVRANTNDVIAVSGGCITGGYNTDGSGISVTNGTVIMNKGNIVGNSSGNQGAIYAGDSSSLKMNGGRICGNKTGNCAGGIKLAESANFVMNGGVISDNYAEKNNGSAVQMDGGTPKFTMTGGTITRNHVEHFSIYTNPGGAVHVYRGSFIMTGGTITGNTATNEMDCAVTVGGNDGTATIGGTANITGNTAGDKDANLYLNTGRTVTIATGTDAPTSMSIGVTLDTGAGYVTETTDTGKYSQYFSSDNTSYQVFNKEGKVYIGTPTGTENVLNVNNGSQYQTIASAINSATAGDTIRLLDDIEENVTVNKNITLDLNGNVLKGTNGSVITVNSGTELTLTDSQPTKVHYFNYSKNGAWALNTSATSGISIDDITDSTTEGTVIIVPGGVITNGTADSYGGGIEVKGKLTMSGGNIVGNKTNDSKHGGGVGFDASNTKFNMIGGMIIGNSSAKNGGGIYVGGSGTLTVQGGTIAYNTAGAVGGGIVCDTQGIVTINNSSKIIGNTAATLGGGIYFGKKGSNSIICNSVIADNTAKSGNGGGVYVLSTNENYLAINGNTQIIGNITSDDGGGMYVGAQNVILGGSLKIEDNMKNSDSTVNNIFIASNKTITLGTGDNAPTSMEVGVTTEQVPLANAPVAITGSNSTDYSSYFTSDNSVYTIINDNNVVKLGKKADNTIHYSHGIYDGFVPYWQIGTAPADGKFTYGNTMTLPASTDFTNVGYKLAGWTTTKPTDSTAPKEYNAGAVLTVDQVNALYDKCTDGEITLYAVWERDLTQIAWNANTGEVYSSEKTYTYYSFGNQSQYSNKKGAEYALGAAISLMSDNDQTIFVLKDADLYVDAEIEFKKNNSTLDGGVYSAKVTGNNVVRSSMIADKGQYSGFSNDPKVRQDNVDNRFVINRIGTCGGHAIQTKLSQLTMKNLIFTYNATAENCNGFFAITPDNTGEQHFVTLDNVKLSNFISGTTYPMFLARNSSTDTYTLTDCEITENQTGSGSVFYVGYFSGEKGTTKLVLKGNTTITGNKMNGTSCNLIVNTAENLTFEDDFSGKASVYLPSSGNMIAAFCSTKEIAERLLENNQVTSDQNYRLTAEEYNDKGAIRVAKPSKVMFSANGATAGSIPSSTKVGGIDTPIEKGVINAYFGDAVTIPGAGTLSKSDGLFMGWNTKPNGTGTNYTEGNTYTLNSDSITLYAKWNYIIASVTHDGVDTYYDSLQKAVDVAVPGDSVKLLRNTKENISVAMTNDFTLDLNGKVLQGTGSESVITINSEAKLTLTDSKKNEAHTGDFSGLPAGGVITGGQGKISTYGNYGGGVYVSDGGSLIMNAGTIANCDVTGFGGGVWTKGTFIMGGDAKITGCTANKGGGVWVDGGTFLMKENCSITECKATIDGGGVCACNATLDITGNSKVTNCTAGNGGGGVYSYHCTSTMRDSSLISGNTAKVNYASKPISGGGLCVEGGTFTMTGGTIINNTSTGDGGGLNIYEGNDGITIGGTAKITGNKRGDANNNLYLPDGKSLIIEVGDKAPQSGMSVGITTQTKPTVGNDINITGSNASDYSSYFTSDDPAYSVKNDSNVIKLVKNVSKVTKAPEAKTSLKYNTSSQQLVTAGVAEHGTMNYSIGDVTSTTAPEASAWGTSVPSGIGAGTYRVWFKSKGDADYSDSTPGYVDVTLAKADHTVTEPTALNPIYNGNAQILISEGSCSTGTIEYSLDGSIFEAGIDSILATDPGTYNVYYRVDGNENYEEYTTRSIEAKILSTPTPTPTPEPPKPDPQPTPTPEEPDPEPAPSPTKPVTPTVQYAETGNLIKNYVANNSTGGKIPLPYITTDAAKAGWKTINEALDAHKAKFKKKAVGTLSVTMNGYATVDTELITDAHEKEIPLSFVLDDEVTIGIPVVNSVLSDQTQAGKETYFRISSMTTAEAISVNREHAGLLPSDIVSIGGDENTPVVLTFCSNDKLSTNKSQLITITFNAKKSGFKKGDRVYLYCGTSLTGIVMYKTGKVDKNGFVTFSVPMVSNYWTIGNKDMKNKLFRNVVALPR